MPFINRPARLVVSLVALAFPAHANGQWQSNTGPGSVAIGAVVGSDAERYVRLLTMAGVMGPMPWAARPLAPSDIESRLVGGSGAAHPWQERMTGALSKRTHLAAVTYAGVNSGFAWGSNDGAMWQGRGVTTAIGVAAAFRWRGITAIAAPLAFAAQNSAFDLMPQTVGNVPVYADALYPRLIDLPQRMGGRAYTRLDPGESTLRIDVLGLAAGITTASEGWGTGEGFPTLLGANGGGFPHVFAGTRASGMRIPFVGRLSARYILGTLQQSRWSAVTGADTYTDELETGTTRIGTGLSVSFMPALLPRLELGASRFYHSPYRDGSRRWSGWSKPFQGLFKEDLNGQGGSGDPDGDTDNQLASFFARWTFPARGVEAAIEVLRDDHNWDVRDFAQEPENNGALLMSFRALTERRSDRLSAVTLEVFDGDVRPIAQQRGQGYLYLNGGMRQGHTQRGQLLGQPIGVGAIEGQRVAWERFARDGATRFQLQRWRSRSLPSVDPEAFFRPPQEDVADSHDWLLDASASRTRYRGAGALTLEGGIVWAGARNLSDSGTNLYFRSSLSFF